MSSHQAASSRSRRGDTNSSHRSNNGEWNGRPNHISVYEYESESPAFSGDENDYENRTIRMHSRRTDIRESSSRFSSGGATPNAEFIRNSRAMPQLGHVHAIYQAANIAIDHVPGGCHKGSACEIRLHNRAITTAIQNGYKGDHRSSRAIDCALEAEMSFLPSDGMRGHRDNMGGRLSTRGRSYDTTIGAGSSRHNHDQRRIAGSSHRSGESSTRQNNGTLLLTGGAGSTRHHQSDRRDTGADRRSHGRIHTIMETEEPFTRSTRGHGESRYDTRADRTSHGRIQTIIETEEPSTRTRGHGESHRDRRDRR